MIRYRPVASKADLIEPGVACSIACLNTTGNLALLIVRLAFANASLAAMAENLAFSGPIICQERYCALLDILPLLPKSCFSKLKKYIFTSLNTSNLTIYQVVRYFWL